MVFEGGCLGSSGRESGEPGKGGTCAGHACSAAFPPVAPGAACPPGARGPVRTCCSRMRSRFCLRALASTTFLSGRAPAERSSSRAAWYSSGVICGRGEQPASVGKPVHLAALEQCRSGFQGAKAAGGPTCACGRMNLRSSSANHLGSAVSWLRQARREGGRAEAQ